MVQKQHRVSLVVSPVSIFFGMYQFGSEVRLWGPISLGGSVGYATFARAPERRIEVTLGGYVLGTFDYGVQLFGELSYDRFKQYENSHDGEIPGEARRWMAGLLLGYKYVTDFGLTANLQLGVGNVDYRAHFPIGDDWEHTELQPIGDFMLGWSF
jgi:hypothetical protein